MNISIRQRRYLDLFSHRTEFHIVSLAILLLALVTKAYAGEFTVTRIHDGDTFTAQGHDIEIRVRLAGVDAPETSKKKGKPGQPYSQEAKKHLMGLIYDNVVEIKGYGLDQYNHILGVVYLDGKNVNLEMVKAGLAEACRGKMKKDFDVMPYLQAEQIARTMQKGMWSMGTIYVSPRVWRKGKRTRGVPKAGSTE